MIAEIYPIARLPKQLGFFDYKIPANISVQPGDIVEMIFKKKPMFGVVASIKKSSRFKRLESIQTVIASGFFSSKDIQRIAYIAKAIEQAPSTVFHATLQGFDPEHKELELRRGSEPNYHLSGESAGYISRVSEMLKTHNVVSAQLSLNESIALTYLLTKHKKGQLLILCPRTELTGSISEYIPRDNAILHGQTRMKERSTILHDWSSGKLSILIGTRQAALLAAKNLSHVIVVDAGAQEYEKLDRNPRIDTRSAAKALARQHGAKLLFTGSLSRCEELHREEICLHRNADITAVNLKAQEEYSGIPLVSESLRQTIEKTLSKKEAAFLLFNKKGAAKLLICRACKHIPFCANCGETPIVRADDLACPSCKTEMWIPESCPSCGQKKLSQKGIGNLRMKTELQKQFPDITIRILDKEHDDFAPADIYLVTEHFFLSHHKPFQQLNIGVVADILFDTSLVSTHFRANEHAAYKLHRLSFFGKDQQANVLIQTWTPEIVNASKEAEKFLRNELIIRQKYGLPPVKMEKKHLDKTDKMTYKEPQVIVDTDNYEDA